MSLLVTSVQALRGLTLMFKEIETETRLTGL